MFFERKIKLRIKFNLILDKMYDKMYDPFSCLLQMKQTLCLNILDNHLLLAKINQKFDKTIKYLMILRQQNI